MHTCRNFGFNICLESYASFELIILAKVYYTTETICQRKTWKKPLWKFPCNFIVAENILCTCAYLPKIFFSERTNRTLPRKSFSCKLCETGLAWMTEKQFSLISFWQWTSKWYKNVTIINHLYAFDYYLYAIKVRCPFVYHWSVALSFVMCSIVRMLERWVYELPYYFFHGIQKRLYNNFIIKDEDINFCSIL